MSLKLTPKEYLDCRKTNLLVTLGRCGFLFPVLETILVVLDRPEKIILPNIVRRDCTQKGWWVYDTGHWVFIFCKPVPDVFLDEGNVYTVPTSFPVFLGECEIGLPEMTGLNFRWCVTSPVKFKHHREVD